MDKVMVIDDKMKTRLGIICFTPVVCFLACFIYYLALIVPITQGNHMPATDVGILSAHYDTLFVMLASSAIITAPIFIYCLVLLTRFKTINGAQKIEWIIFLSVMAPIASMFFWIFLIKGAPKYVRIHPNIEAAHG